MGHRSFWMGVITLIALELALRLSINPVGVAVFGAVGDLTGAFIVAAICWLIVRCFRLYKTLDQFRGYMFSLASIILVITWWARLSSGRL